MLVRATTTLLRTGPRVQRASGIPCSLFFEGDPLEASGALRRGNANARHALKCQNIAASMANFRHTMTAKRGDPGMRDGGGVIPEHFPKEAFMSQKLLFPMLLAGVLLACPAAAQTGPAPKDTSR